MCVFFESWADASRGLPASGIEPEETLSRTSTMELLHGPFRLLRAPGVNKPSFDSCFAGHVRLGGRSRSSEVFLRTRPTAGLIWGCSRIGCFSVLAQNSARSLQQDAP